MRTVTKITSAAALALVSLSSLASAFVQSIPLDFVFSGTPPSTSAPWLRLNLEDGFGPNTVRMTMEASGLANQQFVSGWYVNLNPSLLATQLTFAIVPPNPTALTPNTILRGNNLFPADGDGRYDMLFVFPPSLQAGPRFTVGEKVVIDISRAGGLAVSDFLHQSLPLGSNGVFFTAAHILGPGLTSGWVGARAIPEPSTYALLMGGAVMGFLVLRRRSSGRI